MAVMKNRFMVAAAAGIALYLLGAPAALAEPMRCSGEQKTCNANCVKFAGAALATCLAGCHVSQANCVRNGCWDNAGTRYCGLMKQ